MRLQNAHGIVFRELLYPWHPRSTLRVAVHEAIGKADGEVFRCMLSGLASDRWLEVPAWMFERIACPDQRHLVTSSFASMRALSGAESSGSAGRFAFSCVRILSRSESEGGS